MPGLYAAGEAGCASVHGANRCAARPPPAPPLRRPPRAFARVRAGLTPGARVRGQAGGELAAGHRRLRARVRAARGAEQQARPAAQAPRPQRRRELHRQHRQGALSSDALAPFLVFASPVFHLSVVALLLTVLKII